jgi:thiosulfate/3-mercaptopyruvate sulfurtransferase
MTGERTDSQALVSPDWLAERLDRFQSGESDYRLLEVDIAPDRYEAEHVPGAIDVDWRTDLQDAVTFEVVDPEELATLLGSLGVTRETTVVLYGDFYNWFAAHAYWLLSYYGHPDVRLLDGGRTYWIENGYETTAGRPQLSPADYDVPAPDTAIRSEQADVEAAIDAETTILDVRAPPEYRGEILAPPGWNEGVQRGGHIPGAINVPWSRAVRTDGRFKPHDELTAVYEGLLDDPGDVIVYCRIGERSAHTWVVLHEMLGLEPVSHYYGSWVEWGNTVGLPVENASNADVR